MKYLDLEVKEFNEAGFTGYASKFGNVDLGGDVVAKGAFIGATNVPILISHDTSKVIGVTTTIYEDDAGLFIDAKLANTKEANDVRELMAMGALTGLSIGYMVKHQSRKTEGGKSFNLIDAVDLFEVSVTPIPMNQEARIESVKEALGYDGNMQDNDMQTDNIADDIQEKAAEVAKPEVPTVDKSAVLSAKLSDVTDRLDALEAAALKRPSAPVEKTDMGFKAFLVNGKALNTMVGSEGGFLAPPQFINRMIEQVTLMSPVRQAATVITASAGEVQIPRRTSAITAAWTSELQTIAASQPAFALETIPVHKLAAQVEISVELLQDAAFDLEAYLARHFAEQFAAAESVAFINGSGASQPTGILTTVLGGAAVALSYDALIALTHSNVLAAYMPGLSFAMNLATLGNILGLTDTAGMPLMAPAFGAASPSLFGYPVRIWPNMPNNAILFGNFAQGYFVIDRGGVNIVRDPYSAASRGAVVFTAFKRVGGKTVNPEALSRLNLS